MKIWKLIIVILAIPAWYAVCYLAGSFIGNKLGEWLVKDMEA